MPDARTWALIPSWEWHRAGVDDKRSSTILRAVRVARRMEEAAAMVPEAATARLVLIPGIGPWTSAEVIQRRTAPPTPSPSATCTFPASSATRSRATGTRTTRRCWSSSPRTRASATAPPG